MYDVMAEHARGSILLPKHVAEFERQFVHRAHLAKDYEGLFGFVNLDRVVFAGSRFEFGRDMRGGSAETAFTFVVWNEMGEAVDIAAWTPRPAHVALWLGRVSMLGQEQLFRPRLGEPLAAHASPLEWLRANRQGVVILDHHAAAPLLRETGTLAVADEGRARELRRLLTTPPPRVVVQIAPAIPHSSCVESQYELSVAPHSERECQPEHAAAA